MEKAGHEAVNELFKAWAGFGKLGEKNPEVMMVVPCSMPTHHPKAGIRYLLCLGKKLAQARAEVVKGEPDIALDGSVGCGYKDCNVTFFQALQRWNNDYP